jgi:hypothetical protein
VLAALSKSLYKVVYFGAKGDLCHSIMLSLAFEKSLLYVLGVTRNTMMVVLFNRRKDYCSYFIISVGENVLKVPLNIHTLLERVGIELLKRVESSIVILLLTTIRRNQLSRALKKEK